MHSSTASRTDALHATSVNGCEKTRKDDGGAVAMSRAPTGGRTILVVVVVVVVLVTAPVAPGSRLTETDR